MKDTFLNLYRESFLYSIILWIKNTLLPRLKSDFLGSKLFWLISLIDKYVVSNKYLELIFNTKKVGEAWYDSAFYRYTTFGIRRAAFHIPRLRFRFHSYYIGIFLMIVLLIPAGLWENFFLVPLFACVSILYICQNSTQRTGVIYILINIIIALFILVMMLSIPIAACKTLSYFLLAVDLFFLISFAVRTQENLDNMLFYLFLIMIVLCAVGTIQSIFTDSYYDSITGVYGDSQIFAEILLLLFPFAFSYPLTLKSGLRSILYSVFIMGISFIVITGTQSRAAFIAYFVELIIVIVLINRKYIPIILFLIPTFSGQVIENISAMWQKESTTGNIFENIVYALRSFWTNGFGVSTQNFVNMYNDSLHYGGQQTFISVPNLHISAIYFNLVVDIGAIAMLGFMYYILRIAHSSVTCMFRATQKQKIIFAAGLAALLGISVSSMFESNLFEPRVLIMYWAMLGLLRSGRIIRIGVID